jgi:hypothetical protein
VLLFLDIDGVMVPAKGWTSPELLADGFPAFSAKATSALQTLLSNQCTIMLTTSHKSTYSNSEWKSIFKSRGLIIESISSLPENVDHLSRKNEIMKWFAANVVNENFVIIDDDKSLNELPICLKDHLVQTSPYIGLTEEHLENINSILFGGLHSV